MSTTDREIVITRLLEAPRELVFEVWTSPQHVVHWFGPNGFTTTNIEMNVKPGGMWRFIMHGPNGIDYTNRMVFKEVVKPERISYTHSSDIDDDPRAFEGLVTFEAVGNKTLVTLKTIFKTAVDRDKAIKEIGAIEGGKQTLGRLASYVEGLAKK
jgi:uncharacterized protein YndB with AHSA1/START domain